MPRLLVTGGAGFIGANFVHYWLEQHLCDRLVVLDVLTYAGNLANLESVKDRSELRFVNGNICDTSLIEDLLREESLDTIVHFAAESHVDRSIYGPDAFIETNIVGTHSMLKAARKVWLDEQLIGRHRFHHVSTDEVYGSLGFNDLPFTETSPYAPNSPYAATKAASDHLVRAYHRTYGLQTTISNCSNNYGPYQFPEKLIPLAIVNILLGRKIPLYGDGTNVRDWLYVEDHVRGIKHILRDGQPGQIYNIGGRSECPNISLVKLLCAIADDQFRMRPELRDAYPNCPACSGASAAELIHYVADRPGHDLRYSTDCAKIEHELGFNVAVDLERGLRATFSWYLDNGHWWHEMVENRSKRSMDRDRK